jgi:Protein of unknown function (DUF1573)
VLLGQVAGSGQTGNPAAPRAVVVEAGHDFGPVEPGGRLRHTFAIRNNGTAPLSISRVDVSEPGMRSRFSGPVAPGESGRIDIEWDTDRSSSGNLDAHLVAHVNDPHRPRVTFTLTWVVTRSIDIRPSPDVFFSVYRDEAAERRVTIVNTEGRPLGIKAVRPIGGRVTAEIQTTQQGQRYELVMRVPKGLEPGRYLDAVEIDTDHPRLAQVRVGVNLLVKEDLFLNPEFIDFGQLSLQQVSSPASAALYAQSSTLKKRKGLLAITSITTDVAALRIDRSPAGPGHTFGLTISIDPKRARPGSLEGTIRVHTDDKQFPLIELPVRGRID